MCTAAGLSSFVCLFVRPVHRCCKAICNGEYVELAFTFLGVSLGADRSLSQMSFASGRMNKGYTRSNVIVFEQVAEDITEKAKGTTSI